MDAALAALLTDTVTVASMTGRNEHGELTYGTPVSRPARIQKRMVTLFAAGGRQIVPQTKVVLDGESPITEDDLLTLPDGSTPPIQGIETYTDAAGAVDHYTVLL